MSTAERPKLTPRQQVMLDALREYIRTVHMVPTVRELARLTGVTSTSSAAALISQLVTKGYVQRLHNQARALRIIE